MGRTSLSKLFHHHTRNSDGNPSSKTANSETVVAEYYYTIKSNLKNPSPPTVTKRDEYIDGN